METKICKKCGVKRKLCEFVKHKSCKDGFCGTCKKCESKENAKYYLENSLIKKEKAKEWRKNNPEREKENHKKYYTKNKKHLKKKSKKYHKDNREKILKRQKEYRKNNLEKVNGAIKIWKMNNTERTKEKGKEYRKNNAEKIKNTKSIYYKNNAEKIKKYNQKYVRTNIEKTRAYFRIYEKTRKKIDIHYKLRKAISTKVYLQLRKCLSNKGGKSTFGDILPYTPDDLKKHLESLFEPWMNWDNWGNKAGCWSIDHIRPDSSFDYKSYEDKEFQKCNSLKNLKPMDAIENNRKNDKYNSIKLATNT